MRRFIVWAGILTASTVSNPAQDLPQTKYQGDPRLARLTDFFESFGSPVRPLAADFLAAADLHNLDWRLLPSISIIESGGGKAAFRNNIFGWSSARRSFSHVREGIYLVASRLAQSKLYRDKELDQLLATYNPRLNYPARVKAVMRLVDPAEPLRVRSSTAARINPAAAAPLDVLASLAAAPRSTARLAPPQ